MMLIFKSAPLPSTSFSLDPDNQPNSQVYCRFANQHKIHQHSNAEIGSKRAISVLSMILTSPKTPSLRTSVLKAVCSIRKIASNRSTCSDVDVFSAGNDPSRVKVCVIGSVNPFQLDANEDGERTCLR
jgi:hypothetical protein